jgi:MarR family transcriptional regulator, organic hydroperoxide resistance regulator
MITLSGIDMQEMNEPKTLDFALAKVSHLHYQRVHELLEAIGLYRGQPQVLGALWEQEGLTHGELAMRLHNTPATMTKMLQRMENAGFILRKPDAADQRISRVYLTEAGRMIQVKVQRVWDQMEAEVFAGFDENERAQLHCFFLRLQENLMRTEKAEIESDQGMKSV